MLVLQQDRCFLKMSVLYKHEKKNTTELVFKGNFLVTLGSVSPSTKERKSKLPSLKHQTTSKK